MVPPPPAQPVAGGVAVPPTMMNPPPATAGAGAAGTMATPPVMNPPMGDEDPNFGDPRGKCTINSGYPDDNACLLPPAANEGLQVHVGPTNYDDPADVNRFVFAMGSEASACWSFHTPNTEQVYYQTFVLSGRAGTHHIINSMYTSEVTDGGFTTCKDPGTGTAADQIGNLPGASKAYMPRGRVAPENVNVGRSIPARVPSQADMHYFNFTDGDILREFWMNVYFVPREQVMDEATQIRAMGGVGWLILPIAPGTDTVYQYSCPIDTDGRLLSLLGHYHAHGKRFTAFLQRGGGAKEKVFEMYDYMDPQIFQYNSVVTNPMFSQTAAGATTGILEVHAGDTIHWECHIINDSNVGLTYTNMVSTGEMCNLWGESLGPLINCVLP
jgi:hypothetical protein